MWKRDKHGAILCYLFIAGTNFQDSWQPLAESVWGHPPIMDQALNPELKQWVQSHGEGAAAVLMLKSPMKFQHLAWPPPADPVERRITGWSKAHAQALEHPFRKISMSELALLIRELEYSPIDVFEPSLVRYLFIQTNRREPMVARQGDPPGRFTRLLTRSKTSLVKKQSSP